MRVTIKDVAKRAGVSISTVSYAMNNSSRVTQKTRDHVLKIANDMNYVANSNAKMLKSKKSGVIGLFFNSWFGPVYSEIVQGIQDTVSEQGYDLVACSLQGGIQSTAHKYLREKSIDGAIVLSISLSDDFLNSVASDDFPIVVLDREIKNPNIYSVLIDNFGGAFKGVSELINANCNNILFLGGPEESYDSKKRLDGYIAALGLHKRSICSDLIIHSNFTEEDAYQKINKLIKKNINFDGVFSSNDEMAIGVLRAAKENLINVPNQLKIVGFDDIKPGLLVQPSLSTVKHPKYERGKVSANILFNVINGKCTDKVVLLPTEFIERETV